MVGHVSQHENKNIIPQQTLNISILDEMKTGLKSQGVVDLRKIGIKMGDRLIQTSIVTFNSPKCRKKSK